MEKAIEASQKMRRARDAAKTILGDKFTQTLEPYTSIITATMRCNKISTIEAMLMVAKTSVYLESEIAQMLFIAAACELLEPSEKQMESRSFRQGGNNGR